MAVFDALYNSQLLAFLAIAECKSTHAAARRLNLSQTAITKRIKSLENKIHCSLFTRSSHGMDLTQDGNALLQYCEIILPQYLSSLPENIQEKNNEITRIKIAGPFSIMHVRVLPMIRKLFEHSTTFIIDFEIHDHNITRTSLSDHQLSIVEHAHIKPMQNFKRLNPEHYQCICSRQWQQRSLIEVLKNERLIDISPYDVISDKYFESFDLQNHISNERIFVNDTHTLNQMIIEGYGYGVISQEYMAKFINRNKIQILNENKTYKNELSLVWKRQSKLPSYLNKIINNLK